MKFSALQRFSNQRESEETARAFVRCFRTDDGKIVLEHLHNQFLFRLSDSNISEEQLRFIEGQRQLVLYIAQLSK